MPLWEDAMTNVNRLHRRQLSHWFLTTTLAMGLMGAAADKAIAQQGTPAPDFSGVWGHPYWPGAEPPKSGPGPVANRSRVASGPQAGLGNIRQLVGDHSSPILKPWAAEVLKKRGETEIGGAASP